MESPPAGVKPEYLAEFERISKSQHALVKLRERFAPKIIGLSHAKDALILSLASMDDAMGSRGRLHAVFHGPPGGAKSSLIEAAAAIGNVEVLSSRISPGSLTIDFRNGQTGAFGQAHDTEFQLFVLDELEKAPKESLKHFLRAMEEGHIAVPSGTAEGGTQTIPAHWRMLSAANSLEEIAREMLDRFDFKIFVPAPKKNEALRIVDGIANGFMRPKGKHVAGQSQADADADHEDFLREYFRWCRAFVPAYPDSERPHVAKILQAVVEKTSEEGVRLRQYETILRVAFALARIRRVDVTAEVVMDAVEFVHHERNWGETFERRRELLTRLRRQRPVYSKTAGPAPTPI